MLEQTNPLQSSLIDTNATPLSVSAPRAAAVARGNPGRHADRLGEMIARAETLLLHLETRLHEERGASDRAARASSELEERLRLGVRLLQAVDMQVERGEQVASRTSESATRAEELIASRVDAMVRERVERLDRDLSWRFDRVKEIEERIEQAANGKLSWLDTELASRLARLNEACARVEQATARAAEVAERISPMVEATERAERVTEALAMANGESARIVESLSQRSCEAVALREAIGTATHEVSAAREVVSGELRRMRDDLFWLTERGERISGELIERADSAAIVSQALRAQSEAAGPMLGELAEWMPLLSGDSREKIRPVAEAIAGRVRESLSSDMRGFTLALRQLADRAEHSFANVRLDGTVEPADPRATARAFATELSRLVAASQAARTATEDGPIQPVISANRPIEITV
ncbi:MAG: hypothetical protein RL325_573 [Planctomycetota bacterium]